MKTTTFITLTALSALCLVAGDFTPTADAAGVKVKVKTIKVKPKIKIRHRVVRPRPRIRINTRRLIKNKAPKEKPPRSIKAKAGPQPEPPTSIAKGRSLPEDSAMPNAENYYPKAPELNIPAGLRELIRLTGGKLQDLRNAAELDALRGAQAMRDLQNAGLDDNALPSGSALGRKRFRAGFDGSPRADGDVPGNQGHAMGSGSATPWTVSDQQKNRNGSSQTWTRTTGSGARQTFIVTRHRDGTVGTQQGTEGGTIIWTTTEPADENGEHDATVTVSDQPGDFTDSTTTTTTESVPTPMDPDGDGNPGGDTGADGGKKKTVDGGKKKTVDGGKKSGGGDQGGNYIDPRYNTPRGTLWTPLGGIVKWQASPSDMTSQPPPTDVQGTVMVGGSARPNVGPDAVTNPGDGSFVSGGRGGGGSRMDPCATVRGSGCGGSGPSGPGPEGPGGTGGSGPGGPSPGG